MSSQFFSSRHKTCVRGSKIQSRPAQLGLGGGKDDRIRTGQGHEAQRVGLARICRDNKDSWLLGGSSSITATIYVSLFPW